VRSIYRKIVVLGDTGSGKTALVQRFVRDSFTVEYRPTSGAMPSKKSVEYGGITYNLVIWDIAGHLFRLHPAFSSDADGAILVCDIARQESVDALKECKAIIDKKLGNIPFVVAVNKIDLSETSKCVELEKCDYTIIETSAKTGKNVDKLFIELIKKMSEPPQSES